MIPENQSPIFEASSTLTPEEVPANVTHLEEIMPPSHNEAPPSDNGKKRLLIIGVGVLLFFLLFFLIIRLIFRAPAAKKEVTLNYWGLWEEQQTLDPLIKQYQAKNPNIKIKYQKMSPQDYRAKVLAQATKETGPDIFRFHNTWAPEVREILAPIPASIMTTTEFEKTFYGAYKKDLHVDNLYYGIPLEIDGLVLIYNEDLFKKVGITGPPATWEELINSAAKLSVKDKDGNIVTSGIALGTATNVDHFSDIFGLFLIQNGGDIKKLDQPEAVQALEAYRKFAEPPNNIWSETMPSSITAFTQEKAAMIIAPSWQISFIKSVNPNINLKASPIPQIPGTANRPVSLATYWVEGVARTSKDQLEAWKFLKYLSEKDNMVKLFEAQSKIRFLGAPYSRRDLGDLLLQEPQLGAVIKQADAFVSLPLISRTFDGGLNDEIVKYIENAINSTTQGTSYDQAMKTAKEGVDQVLTKFNVQ